MRRAALAVLALAGCAAAPPVDDPAPRLAPCDVEWDSPSRDASGSMPLGNGDIGVNAWWEPDGDLRLYISKTDSWDDNSRLVKVGRLRAHIDASTSPFRQRLSLVDATIRWQVGGATVRMWVDANHPVIHVESDRPLSPSLDLWRTARETLPSSEVGDPNYEPGKPGNSHAPLVVEPDTVLTDRLGWLHHNARSLGPELCAKLQDMEGFAQPDPILRRTFGAVVKTAGNRLDIYVLTKHPSTPAEWLRAMEETIERVERVPFGERRRAHEAWWRAFWGRSWITITKAPPARVIPTNAHPLRVGRDQHGGNAFIGDIGRATALAGARDVAVLRAKPREEPVAAEGGFDPNDGLTLEAWIRPGRLPPGGGRILDRVTPGVDDGFLLDTWPGNSLRLIAGSVHVQKRDCLPVDRWVHVAGVADVARGRYRLYVDGEVVAEVTRADPALVVTRAYALQRFITACAGRGAYPIKFNGSIFTVPHKGGPGDADYRRWGAGYWWQNTRLPYLGACAAGDVDLMEPLFRMYAGDTLAMAKHRTRRLFGHDGAFLNECSYFWGAAFNESYGWTPREKRTTKLNESRWHRWEWQGGVELVWMMLDAYEHALDDAFLRGTLLPFAREILTFYDVHYGLDEKRKIVIEPAQALETWWDCRNPMPEIAGILGVTERLMRIDGDPLWGRLRAKMPDLPADGGRLAPAEHFANKQNVENPELYAVFPYRQIAIGRPGVELGIEALRARTDRGHFGWRQDELFMAYLGLGEEAWAGIVARASAHDPSQRFPAFWGPNYDWTPDQDHGGVLVKAVQAMLLQSDGRRLFVAPACPRGLNAEFRLHAPCRTVVEGAIEDGRVVRLVVTPRERSKDVEEKR